MARTALTPARLATLLTDAVAALERDAAQAASNGAGDRAGRAADAVVRLQRACQFGESPARAAAGAGRVALPSPPPAEVNEALDALARLVAGGCAPGSGRNAASGALIVVDAIAQASPPRAALLARHAALVGALAGALAGARGGDRGFLELAYGAAVRVVTYASIGVLAATAPPAPQEGGAGDLRALAAGLAASFGALEAAGFLEVAQSEYDACYALALALAACPTEADRRGLAEALLAQDGFAAVLCACLARGAAGTPAPGSQFAWLQSQGALVLASALGSERALDFEIDEDSRLVSGFCWPILKQPSPPAPAPGEPRPAMGRLMAAAPALLERVADVVVAGAPWYAAVCAVLAPAPGAAAARPSVGALQQLVGGFIHLCEYLWTWSLSVLQLAPMRALLAAADTTGTGGGGGGGALLTRLAPALLGLAEASLGNAVAVRHDALRRWKHAAVAAAAAALFDDAVAALGGGAALVAPPGRAPRVSLLSLMRLSCSELPFETAAAEAQACGAAAPRTIGALSSVRLHATQVLAALCECDEGRRRVLELLAGTPQLVVVLSATVRAEPTEQRLARGGGAAAAARVAKRRALAAGVLARLAAGAAGGGGAPPGGVTALSGLLR